MFLNRQHLHNDDKYAQGILEFVHHHVICRWCKHPRQTLYRPGFCRHCYKIERESAKVEREAEEYTKQNLPIPYDLEFDLKVARNMARSAQMEGIIYGDIHLQDIEPLKLENELSYLCERFVGKDFFYGDANILNQSFSLNQKRLLFYFLSLMNREYLRRHRRQRAYNVRDE
jgi:hypothetical protein